MAGQGCRATSETAERFPDHTWAMGFILTGTRKCAGIRRRTPTFVTGRGSSEIESVNAGSRVNNNKLSAETAQLLRELVTPRVISKNLVHDQSMAAVLAYVNSPGVRGGRYPGDARRFLKMAPVNHDELETAEYPLIEAWDVCDELRPNLQLVYNSNPRFTVLEGSMTKSATVVSDPDTYKMASAFSTPLSPLGRPRPHPLAIRASSQSVPSRILKSRTPITDESTQTLLFNKSSVKRAF